VQTFRCLFPWRLPRPDAKAGPQRQRSHEQPRAARQLSRLDGQPHDEGGRRYFLPFVTRAVDARGGEAVFAALGLQTLFEGCWLNSRSAC
jgi:hypothetical protein